MYCPNWDRKDALVNMQNTCPKYFNWNILN